MHRSDRLCQRHCLSGRADVRDHPETVSLDVVNKLRVLNFAVYMVFELYRLSVVLARCMATAACSGTTGHRFFEGKNTSHETIQPQHALQTKPVADDDARLRTDQFRLVSKSGVNKNMCFNTDSSAGQFTPAPNT